MAKAMIGKQAVPFEEVVLAEAFEFEALIKVLERGGLITKAAVLEEIWRLRAQESRKEKDGNVSYFRGPD